MKVKLLKAIPYKSRIHKVGSIVDFPDKFARVMIAVKKAEVYVEPKPKPQPKKPAVKAPVKQEAKKEAAEKPAGYQTRALKAD